MAELAVFSLASKVLSTLASPPLKMAYEKGRSIWEARDQLDKLLSTVGTIHAVLLDAEKKQEGSEAVRNWIKRVKLVLYDADDLFDEVTTDDMLKQHIKGNKKKVRVFFSKLNPIISSNSIAKKVKAIRKSLLEISIDMNQFVRSVRDEGIRTGLRIGQDPGYLVDPKSIFGREEDKEAILGVLLHDESNINTEHDVPVVIAIVGIGGMGKTTLAQLVYNDEEVKKKFEKSWFACISDTSNDREIFEKILQSIHEGKGNYSNLSVGNLQDQIRESIRGSKNFLLVLDDVWDEDRGRWLNRMDLFIGAKSSKIIVTTRSSAVAESVGGVEGKSHALNGLSEDDSWNLFKRVAFTPEKENDPRWTNLGREIVKKCANVPLAIKSIGSLLYTKSTMREWVSLSQLELPKLEQNGSVPIMSVLKLSYDHLNSNLKQCFAYCSLFPKDCVLEKEELIYLWIAQGYIKLSDETQTVEDVGHSYFMDLVRRSFFQETREDGYGEIIDCKMHDLIHDLAQSVAGGESSTLTAPSNTTYGTRHASICYAIDDSWAIPVNGMRSLLFIYIYKNSICGPTFLQQVANLKLLRSLDLSWLGVENLPSSIGELKHLRYLDISGNELTDLLGSITKLLNLCMLNISDCSSLEALPNDLRKLINLRYLKNLGCEKLKYMPAGFEELTSLQQLDEFWVGGGTSGGQKSKLDALVGLKLRGLLKIYFEDDTSDDWDGVESWQPPVNLQTLVIIEYKGLRIPKWCNTSADNLPLLAHLYLADCTRVKCLPPLRHLPNLKSLRLSGMDELEYIEDEVEMIPKVAVDSDALLITPYLEELQLQDLPKLKGWPRKVGAATRNNGEQSSSTSQLLYSLPSLSSLYITFCPEIELLPLCPCLQTLYLEGENAKLIPQLLSTCNSSLSTNSSSSSSSSSSSLSHLVITDCNQLEHLLGESLTSLLTLRIEGCNKLHKVVLAPSHLNNLKYLHIQDCTRLETMMWGLKMFRGVDWDSLPNLRTLTVDEIPSPERLPDCLRQRQALGDLKIMR